MYYKWIYTIFRRKVLTKTEKFMVQVREVLLLEQGAFCG